LLLLLTKRFQVANPSVAALYEDALVYETGSAITASGALSAYSGAKTGRSPSDKRIVKEESSEKEIWWGPVNKPMEPNVRSVIPTHTHIVAVLLLSIANSRHRGVFGLLDVTLFCIADVLPV
jgi:ATP-dependent phosphoenolpyruvate carboxykinase